VCLWWSSAISKHEQQIFEQEAFEKCSAHSPLPAAARPFTRCRYCGPPPLLDAACASMSTTTTTRDRGPLWPYRMGPTNWTEDINNYSFCRCWKYETNCASSVCRLNVVGSQCGDDSNVTGSITGEIPRRHTTGKTLFTVSTISNGNWLINWPGVSSLNFLHNTAAICHTRTTGNRLIYSCDALSVF